MTCLIGAFLKNKDMVRNLHVPLNQIQLLFVHMTVVFATKLIVVQINKS